MSNMKNNFTLNRADSALLARDFTLAARLYRTVLAQDPSNKDVLLKLGSTYVKAGQDSRAESAYMSVLRIDPLNFEALNSLGGVFRRLGKYEESIRVLDRALKIKDSSEVKYNMGFTYKFMEKYDAAAECFNAVIEANPNDVLAYNHLGAIYAKRGDHKKALQTYWKGLQVDQNHPVLHYNSALSFVAQGKLEDARNSYESALRAKPGWPDAMNGLAELYMLENKYSEAQELISQAQKINPENTNIMVTQGRLYVKRGNYNEAESIFRAVLEKRPGDNSVMNRLERVYEKENRFDEAYSMLERMKENSVGEHELALRRIQLLLNQGKLKDAGELLNKEREETPDNPEVLNLLSQYFIRAGKLDKAHGCFKRICEIKPGYVNFLWDAALQFKRMGDYANAEDYMQKYLEKQSDNAEALCTLGDIYEEEKRYDESLEVYKRVLDNDEGNNRVAEAVSRVGAHAETNRKDTADMSELLSDSSGDESPEELKEKIRLYENSIENIARFAVPEDQKPVDNNVGQDIDSFEKIDFDELLKLEYRDASEPDLDSDYSNLIMEDTPVDFESEEYDDSVNALVGSKLVPQDMPFELDANSSDDSGFSPLDYNYTPKYSPSEQNEVLDVDGTPFEDDMFDDEPVEEKREQVQYPPQPQYRPEYPPAREQYQPQRPVEPEPRYKPQEPIRPEPSYKPQEPVAPEPQFQSPQDMPFEPEPERVPEQNPDLAADGFDPDMMMEPQPDVPEAPLDEEALSDIPAFDEGAPDEGEAMPDGEAVDEDMEPGDDMLMPEESDMAEEQELPEGVEDESVPEDELSSEDDGLMPGEDEMLEDEPATADDLMSQEEPAIEEDEFAPEEQASAEPLATERDSRDSAVGPSMPDNPVENMQRDEKTTMDLVSDALQKVMNVPVKKEFRDAADMFKTLRDLSSSLQPVQKEAFFNSLNKLKLDYVIERLSGKPGFLSAASAIRKTGGIAGMKSENRPSLLKTMTYMRTLINNLPDESQSWLLGKEVDKVINKAR